MVAQERHGRIEAEERLKATEDNLLAAEAAMRDMQVHLQSMPTAPTNSSEHPATAARSAMTEAGGHAGPVITRRHLSSHVPYTEYLAFLAHIRSLRPLKDTSKAVFPPPLLSALASQPFLARTTAEDHEPTLRLESAPDLSWLSRRSVTAAILSGDLIIEPVPASQVLQGSTGLDVGCAMCGKPVFPGAPPHTHTGPLSPGGAASHFGPPPQHPNRASSGGRFSLKPFFNAGSSPSNAPSPSQSPLASPAIGKDFESTSVPVTSTTSSALPAVYIFRIAKPSAGASASDANATAKAYPLCRSGWCLERLRATCELWHFIRAGLVGIVWSGDDGYVLATEAAAAKRQSQISSASPAVQLDEAKIAKRSSAPVGTDPAASPAASIAPPTATEPELPRRKSGWGLGFKWKSTNPSGSVNTSAATSPPGSSRRLPPPIAEKEETPASGLGAPLELEGKDGAGAAAPEVPPRKSIETPDERAGKGEGGDKIEVIKDDGAEDAEGMSPSKLARPDLSRQVSETSFASAHETFATASAAGTEQSPMQPAVEVFDEQTNLEAGEGAEAAGEKAEVAEEAVDRASPKQSSHDTAELKTESGKQAGESTESAAPPPPPIPRRAAGRPKSVLVNNGATAATASDSPRASTDGTDGPQAESTDQITPPLLPARPPKTPQLNISASSDTARTPSVPDGEKAFLPLPTGQLEKGSEGVHGEVEEDSWEAKTWRQVVKLKEAMWRARIGVVDEAD